MMEKLLTNLRLIIFFCFYQTIFLIQVNAQTISVNGKLTLTGSKFPVKNASVVFIDNADTSIKFSTVTNSSGNYDVNLIVASVNTGNSIPSKFELEQNYPNPFSSTTSIPYNLNKGSDIQVTIYDILGRVIRKFNIGQQSVGTHNIIWNGCNEFGQRVATGVYFYRLNADGESQVKKMIFNQNGKSTFVLPQTYSLSENSFSGEAKKIQNVAGNTFTVRILNTSTTLPLIIPQELENVVIQNDTTINLSLSYIPSATVNLDSLHQVIRGFGGTNLFFFGRPDMTDSEITTAFGTGDGQLGFTILRLGIDADSSNWSLYVPTAKKAYDMGAIIIASPWYAPSDMVEMVDSISRVRHDMYSEYAAHLNSFYIYMKNNGVPIYGISVQNEPDETGWTHWTPDEMFTFMRDYADSIEGPKVMDPESENFKSIYSDPILNDSAAAANTDIFCGHIYGSGLTKHSLAEEKGKEIWMTEYLINSGNPPTNLSIDTGWTGAIQTAESINNCMSVDMSTYIYWYMVRYYGPISDGTYRTQGEVTKKGYVMSQFARFIRPGFYRVESSVYPPPNVPGVNIPVNVTTYKDTASSKVIIVAINTGSSQAEIAFRIQNGTMTTAYTPYTTSASKNCEQGSTFNVTDGNFTYTLDPSSVTTFVSN